MVLYGIRAPIIDPIRPWKLVGGVGYLEQVLYGIRVLVEQHYEPSRPMRAKHCWPPTNESGELFSAARRPHSIYLQRQKLKQSSYTDNQCKHVRQRDVESIFRSELFLWSSAYHPPHNINFNITEELNC